MYVCQPTVTHEVIPMEAVAKLLSITYVQGTSMYVCMQDMASLPPSALNIFRFGAAKVLCCALSYSCALQ